METVQNKKASPVLVVLAFATVYLVWGSTYFFIQRALAGFPPMLLGAIRFALAGILLLTWSIVSGDKMLNRKDLLTAAVTGFMLLFIGTGIVIWVEQDLPSGMAAIMVSTGPLWMVLLDKAKWKENFSSRFTVAGLVIGFAGVMLLFGNSILDSLSGTTRSLETGLLLMLVLGSMAWSGGSLFSKYRGMSGSSSMSTAWQMLAAGIAFLPLAAITGEWTNFSWGTVPPGAWLALIYLVIMGSIVGFSAYVWLLKVKPAAQVSTHAYVNPVVAVLLGVFFAGEKITGWQVFGLVVILGSVLLINLAKYRGSRNLQEQTPGGQALAENQPGLRMAK